MKKKIWLVLFLASLLSTSVWAHPPDDVKLEYDAAKKELKVSAHHVTQDYKKHYVRKLVLFKNGEEIKDINNHQQVNPTTFSRTIPVEAQDDDEFKAVLYCSEGGIAEGSLIIKTEDPTEK